MYTIPDKYHGVPGHLKMVEAQYLYGVPFRLGNGTYVNIGTRHGRSATMLAAGVIESNVTGTILTVDILPFSADANFKEKQVDSVITAIVDRSENTASLFADNTVRFVFIDGDHSYKGVSSDFSAWSSKIQLDGEIAFHDSDTEYVKQFLTELKAIGEWKQIGQVHTLSWWKRQ